MRKSLLVLLSCLSLAGNSYAGGLHDIREKDQASQEHGRSYVETYVAGFAGINFAQPLNDIHGSVGGLSASTSDIPLKSSLVYGGKVGLFSIDAPYLGLELEAFTSTPHSKQVQNLTVFNGGAPVGSVGITGSHIRMTTVALNVILRYPGDRFQPYIGGGPGYFIMNASDGSASGTDTAWGVSALAGLKVFLTENWGIYAEYKYNHATFRDSAGTSFGTATAQADYDAHMIVGGLAFHFEP